MRIVVHKGRREMLLLRDDAVVRRYRVALGRNPVGGKTCSGDGKTPEGDYLISGRNPKSTFHLSLRISYPGEEDRARSADPGSDIMIHGLRNGTGAAQCQGDWTEGCIAVTDEEIEEIWRLVPDGTPIRIEP